MSSGGWPSRFHNHVRSNWPHPRRIGDRYFHDFGSANCIVAVMRLGGGPEGYAFEIREYESKPPLASPPNAYESGYRTMEAYGGSIQDVCHEAEKDMVQILLDEGRIPDWLT